MKSKDEFDWMKLKKTDHSSIKKTNTIDIYMILRLEQGQAYSPDKQAALDDRFYNSQSFQVCFSFYNLIIKHP